MYVPQNAVDGKNGARRRIVTNDLPVPAYTKGLPRPRPRQALSEFCLRTPKQTTASALAPPTPYDPRNCHCSMSACVWLEMTSIIPAIATTVACKGHPLMCGAVMDSPQRLASKKMTTFPAELPSTLARYTSPAPSSPGPVTSTFQQPRQHTSQSGGQESSTLVRSTPSSSASICLVLLARV